MKKLVAILMIFASMFMLLSITASADVVVEPNDDFYNRNSGDCILLERNFYANGKNGYVTLKTEPGSKKDVLTIQNGEMLYITHTYERSGELWGVTEIYSPDKDYSKWPTGWIIMSDLKAVYDSSEFINDHESEFYTFSGDADITGDVVFWSWPGSGKVDHVYSEQWWREGESMENFMSSQAYRDSEGREWGFIGYMYGYRDVWFCIDDPTNQEIPAFNPAPDPQLYAAADPDSLPEPSSSSGGTSGSGPSEQIIIIIVSVAVAVIATAVLIRVLWKPKKKAE